MSAIMKLTPWCIAIGTSKVTRCLAYSTEYSYAACATPTAPAAVPGRVKSSVCIAILKPSPSSPSRFAAGMTTSFSANADVSVARWPILSRCFSIETPSASIGTTNADRPLWPCELVRRREDHRPRGVPGVRDEHLRAVEDVLVAAALRRRLDARGVGAGVGLGEREGAEDRLVEERRQPRRASARRSRRSGPAPAPSVFATIETAMPEQPQESSSPMSMPSNAGQAGAADSSAMWTFIRPSSCAFGDEVAGCVWCSSYSAAFGRISFSANSRASWRSSRCSGVSANEIPPATPVSIAGHPLRSWLD